MEELNWQQSPWVSFLLTIVAALGGAFVGNLIGAAIAIPFAEGSAFDFFQNMMSPLGHPELKTPLFIIQGVSSFIGFIVFPMLYVLYIEKVNPLDFFRKQKVSLLTFIITAGIVIFFMGFNSVIIEWNANIKLPESLRSFEDWARKSEDSATEITRFLTQFDSPGEFIRGLIVIAVIAGIGEELVFRGLLQPALQRMTKNIHVAIWVSAILFSALHMQFFGFVPRMLLGALFGYLYFWSGNLAVPMFAHFVNNAFSVIAIYLVQNGITDMDVDSPEAAPWTVVIPFTVITAILLFYFKKQFETSNSPRT